MVGHTQEFGDYYGSDLDRELSARLNSVTLSTLSGLVSKVSGTQISATFPGARIGDLCEIASAVSKESILAEVVGFDSSGSVLAALNSPEGVAYGDLIVPLYIKHKINVEDDVYGRVYDGMGRLLESGKGGIFARSRVTGSSQKNVISDAVPANSKPRIDTPLLTGIKVIDSLLTIGEGQRIGLFAGAGCGKTTMLASLARGCNADATIFCLVGERGRELKEFLDHELDDELKARSILVCATSDRSSMERSRAAFTATAIAEALRDQGKKVLLLIDSLTRFARAQREIGLAAGEPSAKGGFPPSVYAMLPRLIERAGKTNKGSITAIYTLLLEGDSMKDPIGDEAKSLLDGHIVLSRKLAEKGQYPAVDVLQSLSRTMVNVVSEEQMTHASTIRELLSRFNEMELLIRLGEYTRGQNDIIDWAIDNNPRINEFLKQGTRQNFSFDEVLESLKRLATR